MFSSAVDVGTMVWLGTCAAYYLLIRRSLYSLLDPILLAGVFVPFAGAFLAVLCQTGVVSWDKFWLFALVLLGFATGGRLASVFFGRNDLKRLLNEVLSAISRREVDTLYLLAFATTLVLALLAMRSGAAGDARQDFDRLFRPLVVLQSGLFLFALLLLLSPNLSRRAAVIRLVLLLGLSIPFSGKSVLAPLLFWYGLRHYIDNEHVTIRAMVMVFSVVLGGAVLMVIFAYGAPSVGAALAVLTQRLWLSGDTYIYAYQFHALATIHGSYPVTFWGYMLHPITSLVGIRGYDKPLGAMMMSVVTGNDVLTGPNPHLPVLLDYFFPDNMGICFLAAFAIGVFVFGLRPLGVAMASGRGLYLKLGGLTVAIFCPAEGFLDTSQVLITLVGIVAVAAFATGAELVMTQRRDLGFR